MLRFRLLTLLAFTFATSFSCSATSTSRVLSASPSSLNFPSQPINTTTQASVTLKNTGSFSVQVRGVALSNTTGFALVNAPNRMKLGPGDSTSVAVSFTPLTAATDYSTVLSVYTNGATTSIIVAGRGVLTTATNVAVSVAPTTAIVQTGVSQQFTANVTGTTNTAVGWLVNGASGGNSTVGVITSAGLYTAPATVPSGGAVVVAAQSDADTTKSAKASVSIVPPPTNISVAISPTAASLLTGETQQFSARVSGTTNTSVSWMVAGIHSGNSTVGYITSAGLYTAPQTAPSMPVTVTAVTSYDSSASATADVTVSADATPPAVSVTAPTSGATVSSTVAVSVAASDNVGVAKVQYLIDGSLQFTSTSSPFGWNWNTSGTPNGSHTLVARALDMSNNASSAQIPVSVANTASGMRPPYTSSSPWNTPIGVAHISPDSATYLSSLTGSFGSDPTQYTFPVYQATDATPVKSIHVTNVFREFSCNTCSGVYATGSTQSVPIPDGAQPSSGSDADLVIWNKATGDEWGFWQAAQASDGSWSAVNGYHYNTNWSAVPMTPGPRGAGIPYLAGLIQPWEITQGHIDHAIAFAYQNTADLYVFPATHSDGACSTAACMPEGSRLQLDQTLTDADFTAWGLSSAGKIVAKALQTYGMIITDTAGHPKVYAEDGQTANWGTTLTSSTVSKIPLTSFWVLDPAYPIGSR